MAKQARPTASDMFEAGWLPPRAAAAALGITVFELEQRAKRREIRRREVAPNTGLFLYEVEAG